MTPRTRFIDWRFLAALAFLILVGTVFYNSHATAQDNEALRVDQHAKNLRIDRLLDVVDEKDARSEELLAGQKRTDAQYAALVDNYQGLLKYLANRGISVPREFTIITPRQPAVDLPGKSETRNPKGRK